MVSKLPNGPGVYNKKFFEKFYHNKKVVLGNFTLSHVSEEKVYKLLNKLGANKATGLDGLPARFIKDSIDYIVKPITFIVNIYISTGVVPADLKTARVVPLFKKSDKTQPGNYRPVSILSVVSKIVEKVVYEQVETYLNDKGLLYEFQSGFRPGYSTDTTLIYLSDYIKRQMDTRNYTGVVLIDLQKAFDTVDHNILLDKLYAVGLNSMAINWFRSYLTGRFQVVDVQGVHSDYSEITCGVPQGSILGPLLFLLYVNDMKSSVECELILYADDSILIATGKCIKDIETKLSENMLKLSHWLQDNKLSLHLGKTESILFATKSMLKKQNSLNVTCGDTKVGSVESVKYLGAHLDQSLCGEKMADSVIKKTNSKLQFLYRKGKFLSMHAKKLLVSSLIQCHFDYSCSYWYSGLSKKSQNKLQSAQNKLIRFILGLEYRACVSCDEFVMLNWLPVHIRVEQIKLHHFHRIVYNTAPKYLTDTITFTADLHTYNTRSKNKSVMLPRVKGIGQNSYSYTATKHWNNLPENIKSTSDLPKFKLLVKNHLLSNYVSNYNNPFQFY